MKHLVLSGMDIMSVVINACYTSYHALITMITSIANGDNKHC